MRCVAAVRCGALDHRARERLLIEGDRPWLAQSEAPLQTAQFQHGCCACRRLGNTVSWRVVVDSDREVNVPQTPAAGVRALCRRRGTPLLTTTSMSGPTAWRRPSAKDRRVRKATRHPLDTRFESPNKVFLECFFSPFRFFPRPLLSSRPQSPPNHKPPSPLVTVSQNTLFVNIINLLFTK